VTPRRKSRAGSAGPKVGPGSRLWRELCRPPEGQPFVWLTREILESPAWRGLSLPARKVVERIILENMGHAGTENGSLVVTRSQFRAFGISGKHLEGALAEAEALGWIRIEDRGRGGNGEWRRPARYTLTWLPTPPGNPATNTWQQIKTDEEATLAKEQVKAQRRHQKENPRPHGWSETGPPGRLEGRTTRVV
jgi:hypothetical protein